MPKITREDIQRINDEKTLLHFLKEKLSVPIPEGATLAQIALPLPLPFLGLDDSIAQQIIDCHDFKGIPISSLGARRPFLIRFRREQDYPEILREVAKRLYQRKIEPADFLFLCADEDFQSFAFAYFNDSGTQDWQIEVLNIFTWIQKNTHIYTSSEHDFSTIFSSEKFSAKSDDKSETEKTPPDHGDKSNPEDLLTKLQKIGTPLAQYREWDIHTGINLAYKDAFVIDDDTRKRLSDEHPNSDDLIEEFPDEPEKWKWKLRNVIYIPNSKNKQCPPWPWVGKDLLEAERIFKESYPAISAHMSFHKNSLKNSANSVEFYWEFPSRKILSKLERPKIIYRTAHTFMQATYETSYRFLTSATHFIPTTDLSLLAILNSKLFGWFAQRRYKSSNPKSKQLSFSKKNMKEAPIVERADKQKSQLSNLVQHMLNDPNGDIEREIDKLIYKLYKLTDAEIALIEEESNQ